MLHARDKACMIGQLLSLAQSVLPRARVCVYVCAGAGASAGAGGGADAGAGVFSLLICCAGDRAGLRGRAGFSTGNPSRCCKHVCANVRVHAQVKAVVACTLELAQAPGWGTPGLTALMVGALEVLGACAGGHGGRWGWAQALYAQAAMVGIWSVCRRCIHRFSEWEPWKCWARTRTGARWHACLWGARWHACLWGARWHACLWGARWHACLWGSSAECCVECAKCCMVARRGLQVMGVHQHTPTHTPTRT